MKKGSKDLSEKALQKKPSKPLNIENSNNKKESIKECKKQKPKISTRNSFCKNKNKDKLNNEYLNTAQNFHQKLKSEINNNNNIIEKKNLNTNKKTKGKDDYDKELIPSMSCRNLLKPDLKYNYKTENKPKEITKKPKINKNLAKSKVKEKSSIETNQKSEVIFNYKGIETIIQCQVNDIMGKIIENFTNKINIDKNNILFLYNGSSINENLSFNQQANDIDKKRNKMNILVNEIIDITPEKEETIMSTECICPECYENVIINIENYNIKYRCKNNHIKFIQIKDYECIQKINLKKIICGDCKEKNKYSTFKNEFYFCFNCNMNLCPLCMKKHNENNIKHLIVNYDNKNYKCKIHNEQFIEYCKQCKENVCFLCQLTHKDHKNIVNLQNIMIEKEQLIKEFKDSEKLIENIKQFIEELKNKLNDFMNNLNILYKVNKSFVDNYDIRKRNYESFHNIQEIKKDNDKLIKELKSIINENLLNIKINNLFTIYEQMGKNIEEKIYETGERYIGEMQNNLRNGKGKFYFSRKDQKKRYYYDGDWENDLFEGKGTMYWLNSDVYNGEWKQGKKDGKGSYIYNNGNIYEGDWKNDKKEGKGVYTFNNSNKYEGDFKNDLIEGKGIFYYENGNIYIGEFKNNVREGKGVLFYRNGDIEMGNYSKNEIVGKSLFLE